MITPNSSVSRAMPSITPARDILAEQMSSRLNDASFNNRRIPPGHAAKLIFEADIIDGIVHRLAANH